VIDDIKTAVVTGGGHGIGRAICRCLHREGVSVAVADLDRSAAEIVAAEINGQAFEIDVVDEQQINAMIEAVEKDIGAVDLFVSNAGVGFGDGPGGAASKEGGLIPTDDRWESCWNVNMMAHVYAARTLVPHMVKRGSGYLVNIASAAGLLSVVCPQAVATRMIGIEDDSDSTDGGFGGNDVDGILTPEEVAECIVKGINDRQFLILPHPQVAEYFQRKAADHDRWIGGMQRFRRRLAENK